EHRTWKAHVTLARVNGSRDLEQARTILRTRAADEYGTHRVEAIHLKRSVLTPQGAQYSVVESVRLEG
ncbi:MAG TPA: RNA 2',3'-cyclic phosphodiesterase, partial [Thermoplasmata archaeon]|nr:RNA 2',3'-cyclic phosphodiesterase [Thermoplasmata archaeon]